MEGTVFPEDRRRSSFRREPSVPSLTFTIYSSSEIIILAFPEDRPRQSNRTVSKAPQRIRAPQDSPLLRDFVGPLPALSPQLPQKEPVGAAALPTLRGRAGTLDLPDLRQIVPETNDRLALAGQFRDPGFDSYDARQLLLTAADSVLEESHADSLKSTLMPEGAIDAESSIQLDGESGLGNNELAEHRLANQRVAIGEVLTNLHDIRALVHSRAEDPLAESDWASDAAHLAEDPAASRLRATQEPSNTDSTNGLDGGMILLAATGDANEGVYEVAAASEITAQLRLPNGVSAASGTFHSYNVAVELGLSKVSAKSGTHDERQSEKSIEQARSFLTARPQQQTAILVGTGIALGAVHWNKKRRSRDQAASL
jgi:hypothetical protein